MLPISTQISFDVLPSGSRDVVFMDISTLKAHLIQIGQVICLEGAVKSYFIVYKGVSNQISLQACTDLGMSITNLLGNNQLPINNSRHNAGNCELKSCNELTIFSQVYLTILDSPTDFSQFAGQYDQVKIRKITCKSFPISPKKIELENCLLFSGNILHLKDVGFFFVQTNGKYIVNQKQEFIIEQDEKIVTKLPFLILPQIIQTNAIGELFRLFVEFQNEPSVSFLIYGEFGIGKLTAIRFVLHLLGVNALYLDGYQTFGKEKRIKLEKLDSAYNCLVILDLEYFLYDNNLEYKQENLHEFRQILVQLKKKFSLVICLSEHKFGCDLFDLVYTMKYPTELELSNFQMEILKMSTVISDSTNSKQLTNFTSNTTFMDLILAQNRSLSQVKKMKNASNSDLSIPLVRWEDVGGLESVKKCLMETVSFSMENEQIFKQNSLIKKTGILFYGPPGTGKTLLAKAIASQFSMNFVSVKGPELLNMYIGESESNVRKVFSCAINSRPCIMFFDEIDSLLPKRATTDSGGGNVMDRIVSQFVTELDSISKLPDVFIIAATNRKDLLDPALLRSGRFDQHLELGRCKTFEEKLKIFNSIVNSFKKIDISLTEEEKIEIIEKMPQELSAAEIYQTVTLAFRQALNDKIDKIQQKYSFFQTEMGLFQFLNFELASSDLLLYLTVDHFQPP